MKLVKHLYDNGHHSVFEHIYFTFKIEGISRACSHQLVRHRMCSFTQRSQRYCKESEFEYVAPKSIGDGNPFDVMAGEAFDNYEDLLEFAPKEDAPTYSNDSLYEIPLSLFNTKTVLAARHDAVSKKSLGSSISSNIFISSRLCLSFAF